ncbi:molecular chaperone GrpE [Ekhidna lutea]|uniref:Protein GrpE n=1 Tax=Ekhidna lutea TaxID=447679 RepID=A0A239IRZ3_EKHLU|nr:nucleotide exchange factor GrpE [Ekhidna lutea]SNS96321.1 molecular chaperone GrpE [Ekhidna lutea]
MKETKEKVTKEQEVAEEQEAQNNKDEEVKNQEAKEEASEETEESQEPTLEEQVGEAKDKYLRLYSEFENFRRRTSKEKLDLISTANKDLMSDLIPVLDDFERAMNASEESEDIKALREGMTLIQNKLNKSLQNRGLKKMEVKKGDDFNDEIHEAITQIPADKDLEGKIVDVVEAGYTLGESVVRFAKVVVGAKQ